VVVAGGTGKRLKAGCPKALVALGCKPLFVHSLEIFEKSPLVRGVVLVAPGGYLDDFQGIVRRRRFKKVKKITAGGATRCDSVLNGLRETEEDTKIVVIHDAARPFLTEKVLKDAIARCRRDKAVVVAVPVQSTIKGVDRRKMVVRQTLDRDELWEAQTPQVFYRDLLLEAYAKRRGRIPTDDAMLVECLGREVGVVEGDGANIKITTKDDLVMAEFLLKKDLRGVKK
jgi:2-C-methyl-D-erythritol 4-phosphate cytidylyltransferase